jgi:hypothetical protein
MEAALFTYRCFEKQENEFPFSVGAFILHGQSEMLQAAATRKFDELIANCEKKPARVHKAGPLTVHPLIRSHDAWQEIDWTQLSRRVEQEKPVRPEKGAGCVFSMPSTEAETFPPDMVLLPEIAVEMQKEFQRSLLFHASQTQAGRNFLFVGSAFRDDHHERTGVVYLIEETSLTNALMVCMGLVAGSWKTTVFVAWCCSIYNLESDTKGG